jgi:hypothetical protein
MQWTCFRQGCGSEDSRTDTCVYHMHFKRMIFAADAMLGWSVDVVLCQSELCAAKGCGSVYFHFDGGVQVQELGVLRRDVKDGLLSR